MPARRVVIVDDDPDLRFLLRITLDRPGECEVAGEAVDGRAAIEVAREVQPDVVVLDEMMPVCTGAEAIPQLRDAAPSARIVLYTAAATDGVAAKAAASPADAYVQKGTGLDALIDAVLG
jgi:DNA-binding NarL/FixJ family response regulator